MDTLKIRLATIKDAPAINKIRNEIIPTNAIYTTTPHTLKKTEEYISKQFENNHPIFVGEINEEVVSYATFTFFRQLECYKSTVEHSIYVYSKFRSLGIGAKMLEYLIKTAKEKGYHVMMGVIDSENYGSLKFHDKFGFKEVGRIKEVAHKNGQWLTVVFLQLIL